MARSPSNGAVDFTDAGGDVTALHLVISAGADLTVATPTPERNSVASSASLFVAVGDKNAGEAVILSFADGVTWSVQYRAGSCAGSPCVTPWLLSKVIWTGSQFVTVGQERPDGCTARASPPAQWGLRRGESCRRMGRPCPRIHLGGWNGDLERTSLRGGRSGNLQVTVTRTNVRPKGLARALDMAQVTKELGLGYEKEQL